MPASNPPMGYPPAGMTQQKNDGMAIASLVLGLLGWMSVPGLVCSILAIVLGVTAKGRIRKDASRKGDGMATAGIVLGCIFAAFWLLALTVLAALFGTLARLGR